MEELVNELLQMTDVSFREKCNLAGVKIGPMSKTTKKLYAKKLARKMCEINGNQAVDIPVSVEVCSTPAKIMPKSDGKFYAIRTGTSKGGVIFHNKVEFDQYLKENKASSPRFQIFEDGDTAQLWLDRSIHTPKKIRIPFQCQGSNESPLRRPKKEMEANFNGELKLPFSEPSQQLLNRLTTQIKNNCDDGYNCVVEEVMKNPRLLLTKAEYPVIFQPGTWSNIVHLCCQYNAEKIFSAILNFIGDVSIMRQLFLEIKREDERILVAKLSRVRENYLKLPRVGPRQLSHVRGDTPLHIAARHQSVDIIHSMSNLPEWHWLRKTPNAEGIMPIDLLSATSDNSRERKCHGLLEEKVIIAVMESDNMDPGVMDAPKLITTSDNYKNELLNSPNVRAIAGPMSPQVADTIRNTVTPKRSRGMRFTQSEKVRRIRLTDPEKGIENVCRPLCLANGISLIERWTFLADSGFVNFQSDDGLKLLECHLKEDNNDKENDDLNSTIDFLTELVGSMQIKESRKYLLDTEYPTKTDNDVFNAINTGPLTIPLIKSKLKNFPNLFMWYQRVEGYSKEDRNKWTSRQYTKPPSKSSGTTPTSVRISQPKQIINDNTRKKLIFDMDI